MHEAPKVSVVMSVYNDATYLREAIESILDQTLHDFEFIIIDDGSTDNTRATVQSYNDPRIRLVDNETNLGLPISLNRGIGLARGEYIARQDADDMSLPYRLERQAAYLDAHGDIAMSGCGWFQVDVDGDTFLTGGMKDSDSVIKARLIRENLKFPHGCLMFRKAALEQIGGYDGRFRYTQDLDLQLRMAKAGYSFGSVEGPLYRLRKSLEPDDFKRRCQDRFRALAFERFYSEGPVEIPDVLGEEAVARNKSRGGHRAGRGGYWYSVGILAVGERHYSQTLKCLRNAIFTGDLLMSLRFSLRLAAISGRSILRRLQSTA